MKQKNTQPKKEVQENRNTFHKVASRFFAGAVLVTAAIGFFECTRCPPPQRFIVPSQRAEFERQRETCQEGWWIEMGAPGYNFGDGLLPQDLVEARAKLRCAEILYRIERYEKRNNL